MINDKIEKCKECGNDFYEIRYQYAGRKENLYAVECAECRKNLTGTLIPVVIYQGATQEDIDKLCLIAWNKANEKENKIINTRADLFEAAAKMMRMCDEAGIPHTYKCDGKIIINTEYYIEAFPCAIHYYEFPLAIVEGKPVFVGDELYDKYGKKWFANTELAGNCSILSWNSPKPKTVMVELRREDADNIVKYYRCNHERLTTISIDRGMCAIAKALENDKN